MIRRLAIASGFLAMSILSPAAEPVRVACVGDSITYGDQIPDRDRQSYPAVLERLAGGRFRVGNFGVNGATAVDAPFRTWTATRACRDALAFAPDRVVVMLGINDFLGFSDALAGYPAALRDVAARFRALPSKPRIYLCTLTPLAPARQAEAANQLIRDKMNSAIRAVAAETGADVIDIFAAFPRRDELLPDGLHPDPEGAEHIARAVLAALEAPPAAAPEIQAAPVAGPVAMSIRNEARAARHRAEAWFKDRPAPTNLPEPPVPEPPAPVLALLADPPAGADPASTASFAALAAALDRAGQETVFLDDGRPVAWREALLHRLVGQQRIDARGGGFWTSSAAPESETDTMRATTYALRAIAIALGE